MARLDTKPHQVMGDWRIGSMLDVCYESMPPNELVLTGLAIFRVVGKPHLTLGEGFPQSVRDHVTDPRNLDKPTSHYRKTIAKFS
jgi:hypothetical protein